MHRQWRRLTSRETHDEVRVIVGRREHRDVRPLDARLRHLLRNRYAKNVTEQYRRKLGPIPDKQPRRAPHAMTTARGTTSTPCAVSTRERFHAVCSLAALARVSQRRPAQMSRNRRGLVADATFMMTMLPIDKSPLGFPMAPTQAEWDALTDAERAEVVQALPNEVTYDEMAPPEGDHHQNAKNRALGAIRTYFKSPRSGAPT